MDLMLFNEVQRLADRLAEMDERLEQIARKVGLHHKGCQCPDCRSFEGGFRRPEIVRKQGADGQWYHLNPDSNGWVLEGYEW